MDDLTLPDGPFTTYVAQRLFSDTQWRSLVRTGLVKPVLTGVWVSASVNDSVELRCRAASLVLTDDAVFCDRTAAWLLGVDVFHYRELEILPPLEVFVLRGSQRVQRPQVVGGERDLSPHDIIELHGVRLTSPLRTALDLACKLPRYQALAALDAFMRRYGLTTQVLWQELKRYRRRRGVVQARELVFKASPMAESPRESWVRLAIADSNLPLPVPQYWVQEHGVDVFRVDFAYPKARVAIEYDGEEHHDLTDEQRERDAARRAWLRDRGWTVIVVTKAGFTDAGRELWLRELRRALRVPN
ncbi:MAG TPA: DUF559 domain-containing protein [Nocardioidaceae bacterium]|nr:DUF559 domain-containing protein [Nocardioidaceae bacterium]